MDDVRTPIYKGRGGRLSTPRLPGPAGFATGFAVPVLATGSTATGLAVPVLETGKGGGKAGAPAAVGDDRLPPWQENGLKKRANVTDRTASS
jgi:hypothetical protein